MDNLLPTFAGADVEQYGWRVAICADPSVKQARPRAFPPRREQLAAERARLREEREERQRRRQSQRGQRGGQRRGPAARDDTSSYSVASSPTSRPGTAMQFFRPGSVLRDNVPNMRPRPHTAERGGGGARSSSRRRHKHGRSKRGRSGRSGRSRNRNNISDHNSAHNSNNSSSTAYLQTASNNGAGAGAADDTDTVFLTRPPISPERYLVDGGDRFDEAAMEALAVKHRTAAEADRRAERRSATLSLGARWREQNQRKMQRKNETNGTAASVPSGTALRIANCQSVDTEIYMSAPSGRMHVLQLRPSTMANTSSRRLGKDSATVMMRNGNDLLELSSANNNDGAGGKDSQDRSATNATGTGSSSSSSSSSSACASASSSSLATPYVFALGSPRDLSRFQVRSVDDEVATTVKFSNVSVVPVQIFWIDYDGRPLPRMRLEPGESYTEASWQSHPWFVQPCYGVRRSTPESLKQSDAAEGAGMDDALGMEDDEQGCLLVLAKAPNGTGDALNVVFNPPSRYARGAPGKLSLSSSSRSTRASSSRTERAALSADSHVVGDPFRQANGGGSSRRPATAAGIRPKAVMPFGLTWGDRRAGRRPASANGSSREAVRILRDPSFQKRRIRHSTRIVRLKQSSEDNTADLCFTICPAIQAVPGMPGMPSRQRNIRTAPRSRPCSAPGGGRHRGISSASSWKK